MLEMETDEQMPSYFSYIITKEAAQDMKSGVRSFKTKSSLSAPVQRPLFYNSAIEETWDKIENGQSPTLPAFHTNSNPF